MSSAEMKPDIEAIYEHYGLRIVGPDRGEWRKAECPLPTHNDRNPSASVNTEEGKWHCHACSEHGDSYDIVKEREGVSGWADIKRLTEGFAGSGNSNVREVSRSSSELLGRKGHRPGRGNWSPPWGRL